MVLDMGELWWFSGPETKGAESFQEEVIDDIRPSGERLQCPLDWQREWMMPRERTVSEE